MAWKPDFKMIQGLLIPPFFSTECFLSALQYKPKKDDIFIATYPKCGTTWMQNIVLNILRKGKPLDKPSDFFLASPFLEQLGSEDAEDMMIRPGALKTHLPFNKVPWSTHAKYIYVARNPKDCCVSFYHHMRQIPAYQFNEGSFDVFYELFITGQLEFNDYFDNLISWYEHRNDANVFFITFEEMKQNLPEIILQVSKFLGTEYGKFLEENPEIFQNIVKNCSFEYMKKFMNEALSTMYNLNPDAFLSDPSIPKGRKHIFAYVNAALKESPAKRIPIEFVRKGEVGNWKKFMTKEQCERFDKRIAEKTKGSNVMNLWKNLFTE